MNKWKELKKEKLKDHVSIGLKSWGKNPNDNLDNIFVLI